MSEEVRLAGDRAVRATVETPAADRAVVACPPHPQMGGTRGDARLQAVGAALADHGVACVRFDYGPWDEGVGERRDAATALSYAHRHYDAVALFGYSFGAAVALLAAAAATTEPAALSVLAPPAGLGEEETATALNGLGCPVQVQYGERDEAVDWEPVVDRARERGVEVVGVPADHIFVGQIKDVAATAATFLAERS